MTTTDGKVVEEYEDIFSSPTEVPLHFQDKQSIDLTLGVPSLDISIPHVTTHTKSTHVLSGADKHTKFTECIQHVHDIFDKSNTNFRRSCLIPWRHSMQWAPLLPKGGGMIQMDIGGHPSIPFGPPPTVL